jgi:MSHA biogenesis protein MshO
MKPYGVNQPGHAGRRHTGFTLIELVVSITIAAVVAVFMVFFLSTPVEAYFAQSRRADLVDSEDRILRSLATDIRTALPGSLRGTPTPNGYALELLATAGVARYYGPGDKSYLSPAQESLEELSTGSLDTDGFYTLNQFPTTLGNYLAVTYPGAPSAYALTGIMTSNFAISANAATGEDQITLGAGGFKFSAASPTHHVFLVSGPVTYLCDTTAQTLRRYWNYPVTTTQPTTPTAVPLSGAQSSLIAQNVTSCVMPPIQPPGNNVGQMLRVDLTLASGGSPTVPNSNELLQVFDQISTRYAP